MAKRKRSPFNSLKDSVIEDAVSLSSVSLTRLLAGEHAATTELVTRLEEQSFAVVEVPSVDKEQLLVLMMSWRRFFEDKSMDEKMKYKHVTSLPMHQQRLSGFNMVNKAKQVFRIRSASDIRFPDYPDKLAEGSLNSLALLERIASTVVSAVHDAFQLLPQECTGNSERCTLSSSHSPFDVFYYNNDERVDVPNLSPHVDPGIITVIPCALSPGLCIRSGKEWIPVEEHLTPGRHVVVFAGVHLQEISGGRFKKAYHAVSKGDQPRVSFAYELRPPNSRW